MNSDIGNFGSPPISPSNAVPESLAGQKDKQSTKDQPGKKKNQADQSFSDGISLDDWSKDKLRLSVLAIEAQLFEDIDLILKKYSDEVEVDTDDQQTIPNAIAPAYNAYQKAMGHSPDQQEQLPSRPFPSYDTENLSVLENQQMKQFKKDWDGLQELRKKKVTHIPYEDGQDIYDAFRYFIERYLPIL